MKKISIGAFLGTVGALGILLNFLMGPANLGRILDFLIGFSLGILTGLGAILSISGLLERRSA
ncbi:MAG: hypothetical protein HXS53_07625 [Theionarchaea archaeon]|nr:hypothetical protein [Theionarchaea archaeon]